MQETLARPASELSAPSADGHDVDDQGEEMETEIATAQSQSDPPALIKLSQLLKLSPFERNVLLLCIAMELDVRIASLCAYAQGDPDKRYPTFSLALVLFDDPEWEMMSPKRPLRHWHLIEINQPASLPLTVSPLRADERIVNYVTGLNTIDDIDDRLVLCLAPLEGDGKQTELPHSQRMVVQSIVHYWQETKLQSLLPLIQLVGLDTSSKQLVAYNAAVMCSRYLFRIPLEMLPSQPAELETLARLWQRESLLFPIMLYLDAQETEPAAEHLLSLNRFLAHCDGFFFLSVREAWSHLGRAHLALDVAKPTTAEQKTAWTMALGGTVSDSPALLSGQFNLNLTTIHHIARSQSDKAAGDPATLPDRLWDACRASVLLRLDTLAQRLAPKVTWNDLVLPREEMEMLEQIANQVKQRNKVYEEWGFSARMNRGLGISALFSGESGTGKTMAAEVIAHSLRLDLYRIDLSAVVSKYIGETEKNLRRLFDAAEDGGSILFFDEADALFGKRSEVKDSHDRYANIEINYLLQRLEVYRGLAILATNMKNALDSAFTRRLRFSVTFPFPSAPERKRMWQQVFPPNTPTEGLDHDRLARFTLTGGSIHNIALNAAFLAAQANMPVTMPTILTAMRAEFRKMERPLNEIEFRW
jgi:hypothetical protein